MYRPITHVSFVMTEECNLRCEYCFYNKNPKRTNWETSKRLIDFLVEQGADTKGFHIQFFGGEPMLEWDLIVKIIEYTKTFPDYNWAFGMTTNATLFTEEKLQYCIDNKIDILLSIDGTPEAHDRHRILVDGSGSFKLIEPWIDRLAHSGICNVARLTYTPDTLPMLYDSIKYLKSRGFEYVAPTPAIDSYHSFTKEDFQEWDRQYKLIAEDYKEAILNNCNPGANYFEKCWRQILSNQKLPAPCGAAKAFVGVSWDGGIYPCHRFVQWPEWKMGDVWNGITNEGIRRIAAEYNVDMASPKCQTCDNGFCGGTCLAANYENNGSIWVPSKDGCILSKKQWDNAKELYHEIKDTPEFQKVFSGLFKHHKPQPKQKTEAVYIGNNERPRTNRINLQTIDMKINRIEHMLTKLGQVVVDIAERRDVDE